MTKLNAAINGVLDETRRSNLENLAHAALMIDAEITRLKSLYGEILLVAEDDTKNIDSQLVKKLYSSARTI